MKELMFLPDASEESSDCLRALELGHDDGRHGGCSRRVGNCPCLAPDGLDWTHKTHT